MATDFYFKNSEGDETRTKKLNFLTATVADTQGEQGIQGIQGEKGDKGDNFVISGQLTLVEIEALTPVPNEAWRTTTAGTIGIVSFVIGEIAQWDGIAWVNVGSLGSSVHSFNGRTGDVLPLAGDYSYTKADVGLENVDNTSDLSKPISTNTQTALDLKTDLTLFESNKSMFAVSKQTSGDITVSNVVSIVSDSDPFLDASQVFKYELDGNTLDTDQVTPVDGTPTDITYDYDGQKFGTAQAVFDGVTGKIQGTASIASSAFSYSMVVTPDVVDDTYKNLIDFATGRGTLTNGYNAVNGNLTYFDGTIRYDLGYSLTVGKQETVGISVNGTSLDLYIDGVFVSNHTVGSTSIDGGFNIGARNPLSGASDYFKGKIDQVEVYNRNLTAGEMESLYFQEITRTDNLITTTDVEVAYHNGYNLGAVNTAEALTNLGRTVTLSASAWNYLYTVEGSDTLTATVDEPVYGKNNKRTVAGYHPDIINNGKTYSSVVNGNEKVDNGTFDTDVVSWGITDATLAWEAGRALVTYVAPSQVLTGSTTGVVKDKMYTVEFDVTLNSIVGSGHYVAIGSTSSSDGEFFDFGAVGETKRVKLRIRAVSDSGSVRIVTYMSTADSYYIDNVTIFEAEIEEDTAYATPRTYLNTKIEADSAGKPALASEWIGASLVDRRGVFEDLEVSNDLETKGKFIGKNACTAWVIFDGTTTPPTIIDSFNVIDVVRTVTGFFEIYPATNFDNTNFSVSGSVGANARMLSEQSPERVVTKVSVATYDYLANAVSVNKNSVHIFGGKI